MICVITVCIVRLNALLRMSMANPLIASYGIECWSAYIIPPLLFAYGMKRKWIKGKYVSVWLRMSMIINCICQFFWLAYIAKADFSIAMRLWLFTLAVHIFVFCIGVFDSQTGVWQTLLTGILALSIHFCTLAALFEYGSEKTNTFVTLIAPVLITMTKAFMVIATLITIINMITSFRKQ